PTDSTVVTPSARSRTNTCGVPGPPSHGVPSGRTAARSKAEDTKATALPSPEMSGLWRVTSKAQAEPSQSVTDTHVVVSAARSRTYTCWPNSDCPSTSTSGAFEMNATLIPSSEMDGWELSPNGGGV